MSGHLDALPPPRPTRWVSIRSGRFWRGYATTMRPYLLSLSGAAGALGLALAPAPDPLAAIAAFGAFLLTYGFAQALTDVTQTDTDALSAPYRPLTRGELCPRHVTLVSLLGLAGCAAVFAALAPWTLPLSALAVAAVAAYTPLKRRWWAGPPWNAAIVGGLPVMGLLCGGADLEALVGTPAPALAVASVAASYACFVILGSFKDVEADRATGYQTLVVRFGRATACLVSLANLLVAAAASAALVAMAGLGALDSPELILAHGLWISGLAMLCQGHLRLASNERDREAYRGIVPLALGFVALHAGELALWRPGWAGPAAALVLAAAIALAMRPEPSQV